MNAYMINEKDYQLIQGFFDRTLNETQLFNFKTRLAEDEDFAHEVELYEYAEAKVIDLYQPNKLVEDNDFRERLERLKTQASVEAIEQSKKKRFFLSPENRKKLLGIAATITFLMFVGIQYFAPPPVDMIALANSKALEVNTDKFYASNRGVHTPEKLQASKSMVTAFQTGKYKEVIALSQDVSIEKVAALELITGIAYRKLGETEKAETYFNGIKDIQRDIALWNLVALYLEAKPQEANKARYYLKEIIEADYNSKKAAIKILENL